MSDEPIKLWVDDIRRPPDESWRWVRTNDEAKDVLALGYVAEAHLDHDMGHHDADPDMPQAHLLKGDDPDNGTRLAEWMIEKNRVPPRIILHSWSPDKAEIQYALLKPHCEEITIEPWEPPCANCGKRKGTVKWEPIPMHGGVMWCEVCVLETQVVHAEERAAALPELRRKLQIAKAKAKEI